MTSRGCPQADKNLMMMRGGEGGTVIGVGVWRAVGVGVASGHVRGSRAARATAGGDDGIPGRGPETIDAAVSAIAAARAPDDVAIRMKSKSKKSKKCCLSTTTKTN